MNEAINVDSEEFEVALAINSIAMMMDDDTLKACKSQLETIEHYVAKHSGIKQKIDKLPRYKMWNGEMIYYDINDINKLFEDN